MTTPRSTNCTANRTENRNCTDNRNPTAGADRATPAASESRRYRDGLAVLKAVGGKDYDVQLRRLAEVAPDLARFTVEFGYGDLVSRPGLDLPQRELCTVASLIALGSVEPQLKYHMHGFLNVGGQPEELIELLILAVALCGFPSAINGIALVREVFCERSIALAPLAAVPEPARDRLAAGIDYLAQIGPAWNLAQPSLGAVAPELARWTVEFAVGDILSRRVLSEKQKHLAAVSMLAARGNRSGALRFHLAAALASAVSQAEIVEVLMQLTGYAGFPAALNAFAVARELFAAGERDDPDAAAALPSALKTVLHAPGEVNKANEIKEANETRRERGARTLAQTSKQSGDAVVKGFDDLAPLLGQLLLEHAGGDIFARTGIDAKTRELAAISALAAVGSTTCETPLRVHVVAALNVGATRQEIIEVLYNLLPYCGYPSVHQAVTLVAEEFAKA